MRWKARFPAKVKRGTGQRLFFRAICAAFFFSGFISAATPAAAECLRFPPDGDRHFDITRNGALVGSQAFSFFRQDNLFLVRRDVRIEVNRQGRTLYSYRHRAEESWAAGRLQSFVGDTDDDGTRYLVRAERVDDIFRGQVNGQSFTVSGFVVPASFWHRDTPASQALWDGVDGLVKVINGRDRGMETLQLQGKAIQTRRFELDGQIQRSLWYDEHCALVRMSYLARDGSEFVAELRP